MKSLFFGALVAVVALVALFFHSHFSERSDLDQPLLTDNTALQGPEDTWHGRTDDRKARPLDDIRNQQPAKSTPAPSAEQDDTQGQAELPQLDKLVSQDDEGDMVFDAAPLKNMPLNELQNAVATLTFAQTTEAARSNEALLNSLLASNTTEQGIFTDNIGCSDKVCGLVLSGDSRDTVSKALDGIASSEKLQKTVKGGLKTVVQHDDRFFGILLGVEVSDPDTEVKIK